MNKQRSYHPFAAIGLHIVVLIALYVILYYCGIIKVVPNNSNLINWDANWYEKMMKGGYYYEPDRTNPLAFFPLFPFFWKISMLSSTGISIVNSMIFFLGFVILVKHLRLTFMEMLVTLSTPSLFFCYLPYTEAFFFLGATLMLTGLDKNKQGATFGGLVIATLSRSVGVMFLPSFIFLYLVHKKDALQLRRTILFCCTVLCSSLLVFFIQYLYTGKWFVYFEVQRHWNRSFGIPTLPFTTFTGIDMLWLDGVAFMVTLTALVICAVTLWKWLLQKQTSQHGKALDFSLAYLVMIGVICTFFSGIWVKGDGTSLMSINRYVFATPFFIFFLNRYVFQPSAMKYEQPVFIGIMIVAWLLLGCYKTLGGHDSYYETALYFTYMSVYMILYFVAKREKYLYLLIYILHVIIQVLLFSLYLRSIWVG